MSKHKQGRCPGRSGVWFDLFGRHLPLMEEVCTQTVCIKLVTQKRAFWDQIKVPITAGCKGQHPPSGILFNKPNCVPDWFYVTEVIIKFLFISTYSKEFSWLWTSVVFINYILFMFFRISCNTIEYSKLLIWLYFVVSFLFVVYFHLYFIWWN